jgi:hypothetical protein
MRAHEHLERVFAKTTRRRPFAFKECVIRFDFDSAIKDEDLPLLIATTVSLQSSKETAIEQLVREAGRGPGTSCYGGWIDQAIFTIRNTAPEISASGIWTLLDQLALDPIDQYGDAFIGFVPDDLSFLSLIEVSRDCHFVEMAHYGDKPEARARIGLDL